MGTRIVRSFTPAQTLGSFPSNLTTVGGALYFTANDGTDGEQLWVSDGTSTGTQMLTDFPGSSAYNGNV